VRVEEGDHRGPAEQAAVAHLAAVLVAEAEARDPETGRQQPAVEAGRRCRTAGAVAKRLRLVMGTRGREDNGGERQAGGRCHEEDPARSHQVMVACARMCFRWLSTAIRSDGRTGISTLHFLK